MNTPDNNPTLAQLLARYRSKQTSARKRVLMISELNSLPFLEQKFLHHPVYEVINAGIETIIHVGVANYIEAIVAEFKNNPNFFDGITGFFDTPNAVAVAISHLVGKPGPSLDSVVRSQNKMRSRTLQQESIAEYSVAAVSAEQVLAEGNIPFQPMFVKPMRAAGSFGCEIVHDTAALQARIDKDRHFLEQHNAPYIEAIQTATDDPAILEMLADSNDYFCEEMIQGEQFAVNGYVYNGQIQLHGIVAEIYLPGAKSFLRHEHPTELPPEWLTRIDDLTQRFISHTGLDNTEFDLEFCIDFELNRLALIEINPRAVAQYENLYMMASGDDMMTTICALACGDPPPALQTPKYQFCYSCELRSFDDQHVLAIPDEENLAAIKADFPDAIVVNRIPPGVRKLSDAKKSIDTYRYCMISIPGDSREAIMTTLEAIKEKLNYRFQPV